MRASTRKWPRRAAAALKLCGFGPNGPTLTDAAAEYIRRFRRPEKMAPYIERLRPAAGA